MMTQTTQKTVAVVTSTIGRSELRRTIESVKAQTYPCKHYIFVDGEQFHDKVRELVKDYPDLIVTYLPMNTGANGWMNSFVNAAAPFFIKEDIICYLDDDNWYDPNHVTEIAQAFNHYPIDMAYNLRRLCNEQGEFIADDDTESLGFWFMRDLLNYQIEYKNQIVPIQIQLNRTGGHLDVNCFAFLTVVARKISDLWVKIGYGNDYQLFQDFLKLNFTSMCTGKRTVNYIINFNQFMNIDDLMQKLDAPADDEISIKTLMIQGMQTCAPQDKPWLKPTILRNNELFLP